MYYHITIYIPQNYKYKYHNYDIINLDKKVYIGWWVMSINKILLLATFAGKIMLESGAEIYRVQETTSRICTSFNLHDVDVFATPTTIIISVTDDTGNTISKIKRITSRTVDLDKISKINDLSRNISCKDLSINSVHNRLIEIDAEPKYSNKTLTFCSSIAAGSFTLMFGGSFKDFFVSIIIGFLIQIMSVYLSKIQANSFFINCIGGALASFIALISKYIGFADNIDKIVVGSLMLLVPGLIITNAIRDTIAGDIASGISRACEAFLIAIAIAVGNGIVFSLWLFF